MSDAGNAASRRDSKTRVSAQMLWRRLSPFTRRVAAFALFNIFVVNLVALSLDPDAWTRFTLAAAGRAWVLPHLTSDDSWAPMWSALHRVDSGDLLYSKLLLERGMKFQYPLSSLLVFEGLVRSVPDQERLLMLLRAINYLAMVVVVVCSIQIFRHALRRFAPELQPAGVLDRWVRYGAVIALCMTYYPLTRAYVLGQVQVWLDALFAVGFLCFITQRERLAGVAMGIMSLYKPQYVLVGAWALLRKYWRFAASLSTVLLAGAAFAIWRYGYGNNIDYLNALRFLSQRGEVFYGNQSFNGLLHRLLLDGDSTVWMAYTFPPYNPIVYWGTLLTSAVILIMAFLHRGPAKEAAVDVAIMAMACTIASPIAWEQHYGIFLPLYAYALPLLHHAPVAGSRTLPWLALSYLLTSNFYSAAQKAANIPGVNIVQSYVLFGGLILFTLFLLLPRATPRDS
jgi:alpha-1,2-mannosyltransferase